MDIDSAPSSQRFRGRSCIVTGGSAGIGLAIVQRLVREGASVLFCGTSEEKGRAALRQFDGGAVRFMRADVAEEGDVEALVAAAIDHHGRLDLLVNNAARGVGRAIPEHSTEHWRRSNAVNVDSVFFGCRAAIRAMRRTGGGVIVNIASISGLAGDGAYPSYCAQKAAVINLTRAMAVHHARENIRINSVCPGHVETPATEPFGRIAGLQAEWRRRIPAQRFGRPDEIAGVVAFLASDDASYIHGAAIVVDGGITASTGQPTESPFR